MVRRRFFQHMLLVAGCVRLASGHLPFYDYFNIEPPEDSTTRRPGSPVVTLYAGHVSNCSGDIIARCSNFAPVSVLSAESKDAADISQHAAPYSKIRR